MIPQRKLIYPLPEAIDGAAWSIDSGQPSVDLRGRRMSVPLGPDDAARFLRAHELTHAKITPRVSSGESARKAGVSMLALQVCEDRRVHEYLHRRGVPTPGALTGEDLKALQDGVARMSDRDIAAALVAADRTGDWSRIVDAITAGGGGDRLDWIVPLAANVADMLRVKPRRARIHPCTTRAGFRSATIPAAKAFDGLFPEKSDADTEESASVAAGVAALAERVRGSGRKMNRWGTIEKTERAGMSAGRQVPRWAGRRPLAVGTVPVAVHRLTTDGKIFARRLRSPGGTVLIDVSGSMSLSADDLVAMVAAAPGSSVAIYSGDDVGGKGRLAIVADRGRRSTSAEIRALRMPGGNVVDGPALQWLARQPAPRVWVCDGVVTGVGDIPAANLYADAARLCRGASIRRVDRPRDAAELLAQIHRRKRS